MYGKRHMQIMKMIFPFAMVTILLGSPLNVQGEFVENFDTVGDWTLYAWNTTLTTPIDHSWIIQDGSLVSNGTSTSKFNLINYACKQTGYSEGIFSFDLFGENSIWRFGFRILEFPLHADPPNEYTYNETNNLIQIVKALRFYSNGTAIENSNRIAIGQLYNESGFVNRVSKDMLVDKIVGWHNYLIEKNSTHVSVSIDDDLFVQTTLNQTLLATYNSICFWADVGNGVKIDNIRIKSLSEETSNGGSNVSDSDFPETAFLVSMGILTFGIVSFGGRSYYKKKQLKKLLLIRNQNLEIIKKANHEFNLSNYSIYSLALGANKVDEIYSNEKIKELLPQEILTYRYLLHPIRLSIMKILHTQERVKSIDIKHILDITWGEYSNHIKSLEQKGYVEIVNEFNENGNVMQVVYTLEFGRKQYQQLLTILEQFISKSSPYEYLMYAQSNLRDKNLYPDESGFE